jgi:hypothetical protein
MRIPAVVDRIAITVDARAQQGLSRQLHGMSHIANSDDADTTLDRPLAGFAIVSNGGHHDGRFHLDRASTGEHGPPATIEKLVILEQRDRVNGGIECARTVLQPFVCRSKVGKKGSAVLSVEIWWERGATQSACAAMNYKRRFEDGWACCRRPVTASHSCQYFNCVKTRMQFVSIMAPVTSTGSLGVRLPGETVDDDFTTRYQMLRAIVVSPLALFYFP